MPFRPHRVFVHEKAMEYPLGRRLYVYFCNQGVETRLLKTRGRVTGIPAGTPEQGFREAKRTLVVGVQNTNLFLPSKPSADYQLPIATGCIGLCEYCYLNTTQGLKPYVKVFVNLEEILDRTRQYIEEGAPETTTFEGSCSSDPIPTETYTGALARCISFFGQQQLGRFRLVTKYTEVDSLLGLDHRGHTHFRFSLNTDRVIRQFEHATPTTARRIAAARRVAEAGYPMGFIIGPIFLDEHRYEYRDMLGRLAEALGDAAPDGMTFELITHRFTARAKETIALVFPASQLPMSEEERRVKRGQFGYSKYLYPKELMDEAREEFLDWVEELFPTARVDYFI